MDDGGTEPGLLVQVKDVQPGTADFEQVLILAAQVLAQDRYLVSSVPGVQESRVLGAFDGTRCVGFLRYLIQLIGAEAGRPAVMRNGEPQPGDKHRELCPENRRRVRPAPEP